MSKTMTNSSYKRRRTGTGLIRSGVFLSICCGLTMVFSPSNIAAQERLAQLSLVTYQSNFLIGEPVVIQVTLTNAGPENLLYQELSLETRILKFLISSDGKTFEEYELEYIKDPTRGPGPLLPNSGVQVDQVIHFNYKTAKLAFPATGSYTVRALYRGLVSNTPRPLTADITISVITPPGEDAEGATLFSQADTAGFVANISRDPIVLQRIERYSASHPQSRFAAYGNYLLGLHQMRSYHDKPRAPEEAERLMKTADREGFQMRHNVLVHLSDLCWEQGKAAEASSYLDRIIRQHPKTPVAKNALEMKRNIESGRLQPPKVLKRSSRTPALPALQSDISKVLTEYFEAFQKRDLAGCLALLDGGFRYNGSLGKDAMTAQLTEEFSKIAALQGIFEAHPEIRKVELVEGQPVAELVITFHLNEQNFSKPQRVNIGLVQRGSRWLLQSWTRVEQKNGG